ncbi:hypothetical protein [Vibrio ouci]|uniref:hypothetical protein n=1 Tax=Vibrio ouci TaxID=2499078 RepID=UPI00142E10EF|nr:hypothetical protein [Vibrio ouci]
MNQSGRGLSNYKTAANHQAAFRGRLDILYCSFSVFYLQKVSIYRASTLSLAHGVRRKNFKEDLIEGLL